MLRHQTKRKTPAAFTLVELIVVITILAILGTIGFLSVGGYSSRARDSTRVADVASIAKSLDLSIVTVGSYPTPDNSFSVTYSGGVLWYQGTVGASVIQKLHTSIAGGGLDSKPVDPLKGAEYTYSTLAESKAYQIKAEYENDLDQTAMDFVSTAYAAPGAPTIAYVRGNFGGLTAKTTTGSMTYVLAIPSILTNTGTAGATIEIAGTALTGTLVFNGKKLTGASSFNPNIVVYSGSTLPKDASAAQFNAVATSIATALKTAYTGTDVASNSAVATLIATPAGSLGTFGGSILTGQLGVGSGGGGWNNNVVETPLYTFASHTFSVCGATGQNGPSLAACRSTYGAGVPWTQDTTNNYLNMSTNGIQEWKVPATGTYTIDTYGAKGGQGNASNAGWAGTRMKGDFELSKGEIIQILVGQSGLTANSNDGGGGGGTFVIRKTGSIPLIIAGGGGGGSYNASYGVGMNATTLQNGTAGRYGDGVGGTSGAGGEAATGAHSAPGGGFSGNGGTAPSSGLAGGLSFMGGGVGGGGGLPGSFGGGGGTNGGGWGGGGGGGYSGGGTSSSSQYGGGGGGSYNAGANRVNTIGLGTGHGSVIITKL